MRSRTVALRPGPAAGTGFHGLPLSVAWVFALLVAAVPCIARADDDLPARVGRIAEFAGQLYLAPQDRATEWSEVGVNYPVTSGDNLWVPGDGRAEVDYGGGQFRLAGETNVHVSRLDDRQLALYLAQGRAIIRVRVLDPDDAARVDTPSTQVSLTRPGLYRIDVAPDRQVTTVTVREGEAVVVLLSGAQQALPGQSVTVAGMSPAFADVRNGIGVDGFDSWSANRDRLYERSRSTAYVSREMVGSAELDAYGSWETHPTYGAVWYPAAVANDWAPYRDGYWTSVGGWGLTWVDAAPWGYAPSHYGRWVRWGGRWGWCPGAYVARPNWAPALVGWYGGGSWGLLAGGGAAVYGWVPLGWGDPYHPWWRGCSHNCWSRYNRPFAVGATVRPNAPPPRYSNAGVAGAMTVVAGTTLGGRKPVRANLVSLPAAQATSAPVLATAPAISPGPAHVPALHPGERGAPPPASTPYPRGRPRPDAAASSAAGSAPTPTGGTAGSPSPFTPRTRPAPGTATPAMPVPAAQAPEAIAPPVAVRPAPGMAVPATPSPVPRAPAVEVPSGQGVPPPASTAAPRTPHAPPVRPGTTPAPDAGGAAGVTPPASGDGKVRHAPYPRPVSPAGPAVQPPAAPQASGHPSAQPSGSPALPPALPRSMQVPLSAGHPAAAPAPVQQAPVPVAPPAAAAPVPHERARAKPPDATPAPSGTVVDKGSPGGGTVVK